MDTDVLVIGGGNAALCAALMAREAGARVLLLESAPRAWRGGNSAHTRNLRCMHDAPQDVLVDAYPEEEYWQDLLKVTGGITNEHLARLVIRASSTCRNWMRKHGVHFQPPLSGALHVARTNAFFMGGGKALDTAKAVAENLGLPCVIIPTVASNDAPCSGVAVLYNDAGVVIKAVLMRRNPDLVLVDTGIIANAPRRLFAAGLGDALSTWFEARACKNSGARTMARGNVSNTGLMMARLCYDLLMEKGRDALAAVERHEVTPALEDVVEATIYLSGLGFENGGLAAAHAVNDGFAQEPQAHGMYHGEKVAFGTLVQLVLEKAPQEELEQVLAFLRDTGLPLTLAQLGVKEIVPETLKKVAEAAVVPTQSTKNLRADITAQEVYDAILEADRIGRDYLAR